MKINSDDIKDGYKTKMDYGYPGNETNPEFSHMNKNSFTGKTYSTLEAKCPSGGNNILAGGQKVSASDKPLSINETLLRPLEEKDYFM